MIWSSILVISIIIIAAYFFFQPLHIKVPGRDAHHPTQELHESEDIVAYLHGDNLDISARYYNSREDKLM